MKNMKKHNCKNNFTKTTIIKSYTKTTKRMKSNIKSCIEKVNNKEERNDFGIMNQHCKVVWEVTFIGVKE
jgi:ABC-type Mn2+/Zn2+ transport system ATPase subunit